MKIEPVTIKITDNWRYCLVAWLMDRDDFLADLQKARKELGINEKLVDYKIAKEWFKAEFEKEKGRFIFPKTKSEKVTANLLTKYHKSPLFFEAVRYAIVTGIVTDKEFARTAFCQVLPPDYQMIDAEHDITNLVDHDQPVMTIVISPETKLKEVARIFKEEVPHLRTEYVASYLRAKQFAPDVISNVKRDRRWYWLHKQGMSYKDIFNKEGKKTLYDLDGVIKAIKRYQKKLSVDD
ncbi:MAG: hypothetical protein ABIJ05_03905 [Patescibacteria group bacterium]